MKNKIYSLLTAILFAFSISALAQTPPPPNGNGGDPTGGGHTPVGGGAPIGSGLIILMTLGAAYGTKKVYDFRKRRLED